MRRFLTLAAGSALLLSPQAHAETVPAAAPMQIAVVAPPVGPGLADAAAVPADPLAVAIAAELAKGPEAYGLADKRRHAAVAAFYRDNANRPLWSADGRLTDKAKAALARLEQSAADGLDPADFPLPYTAVGAVVDQGPALLAEWDVRLSLSVVTFAEEASGGRVAPAAIDRKNITRKPPRVNGIEALRTVAAAGDPAAVLDGFNPPHAAFDRLKARLAVVRATEKAPPPPPIAEGATLKPGMTDVRVADIRGRLGVPAPSDPLLADLYDEDLVGAVKTYQEKAGLIPDGIIGPRTLGVLNGVDRDEEGEILANMEMWRWMPRDLGRDHILVNVPEFMVRIVRSGHVAHETRVVVGRPGTPTPIFSDEMDHLVVNPYWNVPESIKTKEMLPQIQADPASYFARHGYEVLWQGRPIDPATVIWDENAMRAVHIRQVPGEANALGNIKFMFPNQHAVYLHDTPSRKLFRRDYRAYSHGCVRVDDPLSFAAEVLRSEPMWTVDKVKAMFGGSEKRLDLTDHLPVHIAYFTAWVDDAGVLQMRDDLYGHVKRVKAALGLPTG